ncbi:hypothetical protein EFP18_17835 [Burkholderia glumae]|uniref:hypothetical protein n=2 Tax=Burkholderia glumae TaxID=337 RepID=UPI00148EA22D|nr:hypothetical protein [Burkholderia glumae]MCM2491396.1 hypothetical protein [Burkholderia glumae]MCM2542389.1 hypothetical protein [Burkholderia glumae]MCQ0031640.1 hypothetical protein [Burkholderia glumae]MCQ0038386.1 hypothetical protein [Burkholderia glumae]QJW79240.1 hypothetical protein GAS18_11085 [Burkholderia glumae]
MSPRVTSGASSADTGPSSPTPSSHGTQQPAVGAPTPQATNALTGALTTRSRGTSNASDASDAPSRSSVRTMPLPGSTGAPHGPIALNARTQGLHLRSVSDSHLPRSLAEVGDPPADLPPTETLLARSIKEAIDSPAAGGSAASSPIAEISTASLSAPANTPMTLEETRAAIAGDLEKVSQLLELFAEMAPHLASEAPGASDRASVASSSPSSFALGRLFHSSSVPNSGANTPSSLGLRGLYGQSAGNSSASSEDGSAAGGAPSTPSSLGLRGLYGQSAGSSSASSEDGSAAGGAPSTPSSLGLRGLYAQPSPSASPASSEDGHASESSRPGSDSSSDYHLDALFDAAHQVALERASTSSESEAVGMDDDAIAMHPPGTGGTAAGATTGAAAAQKSALMNWLGNVGQVGGHEAVAVGLTTAIREVVAGLVQHLQNAHQGEGSLKAQEAAAGAIIALVGLGNIAAMLMRRSRHTNTPTANAGNVLQLVGLISTAIGAGRTGNLKDLLPQLTRTVVYAGLRDAANTVKPYSENPQAGNALLAQLVNFAPYSANQFLVNWAQTAGGTSGAGFANKLDEISKMTNQTEAAQAKGKLGHEVVLNGGAYVGANMLGEVFDKLTGSVIEQALGEGWASVPQMAIGHDPIRMPGGSDWGDAFEKTISRMSLFDQAISGSAWIGTGVTTPKFGEFGGTMINNAVDGALVSLLCLPFVMTLMKKKAGGTGNDAA